MKKAVRTISILLAVCFLLSVCPMQLVYADGLTLGDAYGSLNDYLSLTFDFADPLSTGMEGTLSIRARRTSAYNSYTVSYADENGVLPGYAPIGRVEVNMTGFSYTVFTGSALIAPPSGATTVVACDRGGIIRAYAEIPVAKRLDPSEKIVSFAALSDVHVFNSEVYGGAYDSINGDADLVRAVGHINAAGVDFTAISGDLIISFDGTPSVIEAELTKSTNILKTASAPVYVVKGNHDKMVNETLWKSLTGCDTDYYITVGDDYYVFLSLRTVQNVSSNDDTPYGSAKLAWLRGVLEEAAGKRVCLFMHYPFAGLSGLRPGERYGFTDASTEEEQILEMIADHGAVTVFNGHTHYDFESTEQYPNINVCRIGAQNTYSVHVPSVAYPRDYSYNTVTEESQGYIVEVYPEGMLLKGMDFTTGEYVPTATWFLDTRKQPNALASSSVDVGIGETAQVAMQLPYESASFRSLDESIVTVDASGTLRGIAAGSATVVCRVDGFEYRLKVRVRDSAGVMSGSGTADDPYVITTASQFCAMQEQMREGENFTGVYFALANDICLNDCADYEPCTNLTGGTFAGSFDGLGHTISAATEKSSADFAVPFFWTFTGKLRNIHFVVDHGGCAKTSYVVARTMSGGSMVNCIVEGSLYASNVNTAIVCGTSSGITLSNLFINVAVSGTTPGRSESGISTKGSGSVTNVLYVANGCTAQFGEMSVTNLAGVAATMNNKRSGAATAGGVTTDELCRWTTVDGAPALIAVDPAPAYLLGDLNDDGVCSIADVSTLLGLLTGGGTVAGAPRADVNGDGNLSIADVSKLLQIVSL